MLEFKKEYFQTETNRHLYPTTLDISKCEVYGCKDREAFVYKIPNERYTSNAGNIDFSLYPNGVWSDYTAIKIVEKLPYFQPSINFNKLGDITPSNLNKLKDEIKKHIVDLETAITESYVFIDSGSAGQNNLPYLPEGCVWFRDPIIKDVIALPISDLYGKFNQMVEEIRNVIKDLINQDISDETKKLLEKLRTETDKLLEELNQASAGLPNRVTALENKTTQNRKELEDLINTARTENIQPSRIVDNSISSSKLKIATDEDKIKLVNLSDEVKKAMTGNTPVSPTLQKDSVVREYIADGAINDEKIDGLGVTLRGITKSLENNIILEKGNGGAKILNGKAIEKVVINNETFALDVTYKSNPRFDGIIFDNNQGIFEIQATYDTYVIIGSDTEKSKYYTFRPNNKNIEFGYFTSSYTNLGSTTINTSLSRVCKFRVSKDKIDILDTSNNDNVAFTITPESVPEIAEAFNNQVVGIMIWSSFVLANGKITLFSQYLESSNLNDKITNLEKSNEDLKNKIFVERKMYATNKDITLDNPLAITKGVQSISYDSVKGTTSATKISGSGYRYVFLGYKCDTMEMELVAIKYIMIGISNKNPDELFLYSPKNGSTIRYNNKTDAQTQVINIGALTGYENKRMTFSYKNGYLKISDKENTYINYNWVSKLDELLIKDFEVAFGKLDSPIKANFSIGEDISIVEKVNQNTESIKETNLKIIEESEKINTRIDSIITSGGNDDSVDVVLFMGQSNMAGRGTASEAPIVPEGIAYEFRAVSDPTKLYQVTEPFGVNENREGGINEPGAKSGSMVSSLILNYYTYSGRKIVGISASRGGTSIGLWQPTGGYLKDIRQRLNDCLSYLEKKNIRVRDIFMFWCQGETDGDNSMTKEEYKQKFNSMWQFMKTELNVSKCFVVRIGYVNNSVVPNKYATIIEAQREICEYSDELILVSTRFDSMKSEGLMRDSFHYKQIGYNLTGEDAGKNTAYYLKTGRKPSFYDWHYNDIYVPKYGTKKE